MRAYKVAEQIARDTSCAQGEFSTRVRALLPYLTEIDLLCSHLQEMCEMVAPTIKSESRLSQGLGRARLRALSYLELYKD